MNAAGFEPTTSASGGQRSIQLSYASKSSVCYGEKQFLSIAEHLNYVAEEKTFHQLQMLLTGRLYR